MRPIAIYEVIVTPLNLRCQSIAWEVLQLLDPSTKAWVLRVYWPVPQQLKAASPKQARDYPCLLLSLSNVWYSVESDASAESFQ